MMNIDPYPHFYVIGEPLVMESLNGIVVIEEKVDGEQFGFGVDGEGNLTCRYKGDMMDVPILDGSVRPEIETAVGLKEILTPGWVYYGEFLERPTHNRIAYERVPVGNVILFDVLLPGGRFMTPYSKQMEAARLGLECVPCYYEGTMPGMDKIRRYLTRPSVLGGHTEGLVIKKYDHFWVFQIGAKIVTVRPPDKEMVIGELPEE
jgi:hypothetical protein